MGEGSSGPGSTLPAGAADSGPARVSPSREPVTRPRPADPARPSYEPVRDMPWPETYVAPAAAATPSPPTSEVLRYGPGVPESQAGAAAESVWRTGHRPEPPPRQQRLRRLRRLLGTALTVALLIAAGVVLWLRFFDHPPFRVTGADITDQVKTSCGMDVTARIDTNGSAGTVSYQWVFRPQTQAPQPLNQSVNAGQHAVYVTVAVEGRGHGSATQTVTLQVLGPDTATASRAVTISC
jgi:hypothetical protein